MNDRLKTRLWDKKNKIMHYNDFVITATGYIAKIEQIYTTSCENYRDDNPSSMFYIDQEDMSYDNELVLMQCTGLKDKNGKLIFEGDILKNLPSGMFLLEDEKEKRESIRYWSVEHKIFRGDVGFRVYGKNRRWSKILTPNMIYNCDCEICGNIYENTQLEEEKCTH